MRFFTVYGPWGRPDMAPMIFTRAIFEKKPIKVFNGGKMARDFTYIDDVIQALFKLIKKPPGISKSTAKIKTKKQSAKSLHQILNIGNSQPINLMDFIKIIESEIGIDSIKLFEPMQPGDVEKTYAETKTLEKLINYFPSTKLESGIKIFIEWYKRYYLK